MADCRRLQRKDGIVPVNPVADKDNIFKAVSFPSSEGIDPAKSTFPERSRDVNLEARPKSVGTEPVSEFPLSTSLSNFISAPSCEGIIPTKPLDFMLREVRCESSPIVLGRLPREIPRLVVLIATTRFPSANAAQETPFHCPAPVLHGALTNEPVESMLPHQLVKALCPPFKDLKKSHNTWPSTTSL